MNPAPSLVGNWSADIPVRPRPDSRQFADKNFRAQAAIEVRAASGRLGVLIP